MKTSLLFFCIIFTFPAQAQDSAASHSQSNEFLLWGSIGVGAVGPGIGGVLQLTSVFGDHSISAKLQGGGTYSIEGSSRSITEYSLFYGRQKITELTIMRFAAGPALFESSSKKRFGIGMETDFIFAYRVVGIGIQSSLMLAPQVFYAGITLTINFGKLF